MSNETTIDQSKYKLWNNSWLNFRRIRDYPRLFFFASWVVLILNVSLGRNWIGGLTHYLIWGDFLTYYAAGELYRFDIGNLYDLEVQLELQTEIIGAETPIELSMYSYPPYAALLHSALTYLSYPVAVISWAVLALICVILAAWMIRRHLLPAFISKSKLSTFQVAILVLSSFSFIQGFEKGQSHSITLLLIVGVLVATRKEKWYLAGILAALSSYKPHFLLGILLVWFVWRKYRAIISYAAVFAFLNVIVLASKGIDPYIGFLNFSEKMMYIPYTSAGFPNFIMATPFALVATMLPFDLALAWFILFLVVAVAVTIWFFWQVYISRTKPLDNQNDILAVATLIPFIVTPYALLHDLLILFPVFILLAHGKELSKQLLYLSIATYISLMILPLVGSVFHLALTGIIPVAVFVYSMRRLVNQSRGATLVYI